jgi:hypothetical protein
LGVALSEASNNPRQTENLERKKRMSKLIVTTGLLLTIEKPGSCSLQTTRQYAQMIRRK